MTPFFVPFSHDANFTKLRGNMEFSRVTESGAVKSWNIPRAAGAPNGRVSSPLGAISMKARRTPRVRGFEARLEGRTTLRLVINGVIGEDVKSSVIENEINEYPDLKKIHVSINSVGGNALEGAHIFGVLRAAVRRGIEVIIEVGAACMSAATLVACAGTQVLTARESLWMFHNPAVGAEGEAKDLREVADELDKVKAQAMNIYLQRNPTMSEQDLSEMLDNVTWLTGEEAVEQGWADGHLDAVAENAVMALNRVSSKALAKASKSVKARLKAMKAAVAKLEGDDDEEPEPTPQSENEDEVDMNGIKAAMEAIEETVDALAEQLAAAVTAIEEVAETVAEETGTDVDDVVDPDTLDDAAGGGGEGGEGDDVELEGDDDEEPAVDMKKASVIALYKLAKLDGRGDEFKLLVDAGANEKTLRARFVNGQVAKKPAGSSAALNGGGPVRGAKTKLKTSDYYAHRRAGAGKK